MNLEKFLENEIKQVKGNVTIEDVPKNLRPSVRGLEALQNEVNAQVRENESASNKSMVYASRVSLR